jgi:Uma2 family endonuclease
MGRVIIQRRFNQIKTMRSPIYLMSSSEYLEAEVKSEIRHEYVDGEIFAMAGGSRNHNRICGNIYSQLRTHLRATKCEVFMSDMKVWLKSLRQNKMIFYYPDILVTCNPQDRDPFLVDRPCLIIEVLSPSTEMIDKREKLVNHKTISSLQEYVLISQDQIKVEVYRQDIQGNWTKETLEQDGELYLNSIDITLKMTDIYEDIFEAIQLSQKLMSNIEVE